MSPLKDTAEFLAKQAAKKAEYELELDAYIAAVKRRGGPDMTRSEAHYILFTERRAAAHQAAQAREAEIRRITSEMGRIPRATDEPDWHRPEEWVREDFIRASRWDQAHGGRGGKSSLAFRCSVSPSKLYRRWQAVAPGEPFPSGNKGPSSRT